MCQGFTWTRRLVVAGAAVVLSLIGHELGYGALPSPVGLLLTGVVALALALGVRPRMPLAHLAAVVLGGQLLIHLILVLSADCAAHGSGVPTLIPSSTMVMGHLLASAAALVVLRRGDQVLCQWSALLSAAFSGFTLAPCTPEFGDVGRPASPVLVALFSRASHAEVTRRGPPHA